MKKTLLLLFVLVVVGARAVSQPQVSHLSCPTTVNLFDLYEISFSLGHYSNPYNPDTIAVYAIFIGPDNTSYTVNGFYYEGYSFSLDPDEGYEVAAPIPTSKGWKIRFTPTQTGIWSFCIHAIDIHGETVMPPSQRDMYYFTCLPITSGDGFISKANSRFLHRDVVNGGVRQFDPFFPIGPNVAWYACNDYPTFEEPFGIYEYKKHIDSLTNKANYMRVWLNRFQYLSLYGPEFTQHDLNGNHIVYFDNTINQKDSAELDYIINYTKQHGVTVMPCLFNARGFKNAKPQDPNDSTIWIHNPFHTILGLENPCEFFTDEDARSITKNLLRYIVSRWGYATNVLCWEFWNEVNKIITECDDYKHIEQDILDWHEEMRNYVYSIDPYKHMMSTSLTGMSPHPYLYSELFDDLDFVQIHRYGEIQNAELTEQVPVLLYKEVVNNFTQYPLKPSFIGEFGFSQGNYPHISKDPFGINLHNSNWSSLFSSTMGAASFWWWPYVDSCALFRQFTPLLRFCENIPLLSDSFTPHHTGQTVQHRLVFPNGLQTFYMINTSQDTIYGWSQDTVFAYPALRRLTDTVIPVNTDGGLKDYFKDNAVFDPLGYVYTMNPAKRPAPSSNNNNIKLPITNQPTGTNYLVTWYDTETGNLLNTGMISYAVVIQDPSGNKYLSFQFPAVIRSPEQHTINNLLGDAAFIITKTNSPIHKQLNR